VSRTAWIAVGGVSALAFGLAVALVIALATAGDDEGEAAAEPPGVVAPGGSDQTDALRECMAENGVEPPEPGTLQTEPPPGFEEALEACRHLLPEGGGLRIAPG
jgi:hypothetical protein